MLHRKLDNGLTILAHRNAAAPAVALQVWVKVGSADEHDGEYGLAHVHEHMLFKGTKRRAVGEIAAEVEAAGGDINAFTSYDQTVYHVVMSSRFFDRGLDVLSDAVRHSSFDPAELERELEVVLEEIKRSEDSAPRVAAKMLFRTAFQVHPYSLPVIGTAESVRSFTRDRILRFYKRWYTAANIVVVAVGDLDETEAATKMAMAFQDMPTGEPSVERPPEPPQDGLRFGRGEARFKQTWLNIAFHVPNASHADVPTLDILALILGQGESSRLTERIKRGTDLVNDVTAYAYTPRDPGLLVVTANLPEGDAQPAFSALVAEIFALREHPFTVDELDKARTILESQRIYERESVAGQARKFGFYESVAGGWRNEEAYMAGVRATTPESLMEAARRYLSVDNMTVTVLVPDGDSDGLTYERIEAMALAAQQDAGSATVETVPSVTSGDAKIVEHTLDSGTRLVLLRDPSTPLVSLRAVTLGGLACEPSHLGGVSRLTAAMMNRGAGEHSASEMARQIESLAAGLDANSGRASAGIRLTSLSRHFPRSWEFFRDVLERPRFEAEDLRRERALHLEHLRSQADRPASLTIRAMLTRLFGDHPYGRPVLGTEESVAAITRDDLVTVHTDTWQPSRMVVAAVGDFDIDEMVDRLEDAYGQSSPSDGPAAAARPASAPSSAVELKLTGRGEQAHIALGFQGVAHRDPERATLDVLLTVLSGQGGRLFLELRDRQSLAYSVTASSFEGYDAGYALAYMGTSPEKLSAGVSGLREVLQGLCDARITPEELARAQQYIVGSYEVGLQRRSARAGTLAYNVLFEAQSVRFSDYTDRIMAVTREDVRTLAARVLDFDKSVLCILEPAGE